MPDQAPDEPPERPGTAAFLSALEVRRNAKRALAVGVVVAVAVYVFFVAIPGSTYSPVLFVGLGFVLAMSVAGLVFAVLLLVRAYRLTREL